MSFFACPFGVGFRKIDNELVPFGRKTCYLQDFSIKAF